MPQGTRRIPWRRTLLGPKHRSISGDSMEKFEELVTCTEGGSLWPMLECFYYFLPVVRGHARRVSGISADLRRCCPGWLRFH